METKTNIMKKEFLAEKTNRLSLDGVYEVLERITEDYLPAGCTVGKEFGFYILGRRAWVAECSIAIGFNDSHETWTYETFKAVKQKPSITLNWSSTKRTVAEALASITLYDEMVRLAALVEARLNDFSIWDLKEL